jgi:hypothetical protein
MHLRSQLVPGIVGVFASLVAAYVYTNLATTSIGLPEILAIGMAAAAVAWLLRRTRGRLRLGFLSPIDRFYPKGQVQFAADLLDDLRKSKTIKVIGARGLDLVGERSVIGELLSEDKWNGSLEAYLLNPTSDHGRLRVNHLDVEREKYQAEVRSVQSFLGIIAARNHVSVTTYEYDAAPLFRAYVLEQTAYAALYQEGVQGRLLATYRVKSTSPLYLGLLTYCKHLRSKAVAHALTASEVRDSRSQ